MRLFGLAGAEPVAPDDPRLPPELVRAMACGKGTSRFLVFEVWTAGAKVATLCPNSGSDGTIVIVGNPRRGRFRQVGYLVESFAAMNAEGKLEFDLLSLFGLPLQTVCGIIEHAARATTLVWSEYASLAGLHGHLSPSRKLLLTVAENERARKTAIPAPSGVFPGPNRLAEMRGTPLSAPVKCSKERRKGQPDRWVITFKRFGDYILLCGGGTDRNGHRVRRLSATEMPAGLPNCTNPLVNMQMGLEEFIETCVQCGIYRQLWAKRQRRARVLLTEMIEEAKANGAGDALSSFLVSLETSNRNSADEIYSVLPRPPPCLRLNIPSADYEKAFKFDQRWFINRVCSGLTACGQHQLAYTILNGVDMKGTAWAGRRRASEDKHRGRMREMENFRGKTNPSCSGCTISSPDDCIHPLDPRQLTNVGPVEIVVELAKAEFREQSALDDIISAMELPSE